MQLGNRLLEEIEICRYIIYNIHSVSEFGRIKKVDGCTSKETHLSLPKIGKTSLLLLLLLLLSISKSNNCTVLDAVV